MSRERSGKYGIHMKRFCRQHEAEMSRALEEGAVTQALLRRHLETLHWVQHERLVHLIVLVMTVFAELVCVMLTLLKPETNPFSAVIVILLAILLAFYFYHYFFLENSVQRWYRIAQAMMDMLGKEE